MIEILQYEVGLISNFNELISSRTECAVVDPAFEVDRLLREAQARAWQIRIILVTHTHPDHIEGLGEMVEKTGARVYVGKGELANARAAAPTAEVVPLEGGERIPLGDDLIEAIATPGHTVSGISYRVGGAVMTGDTLFVGGVGRTDFPGGDPRILWRSLQTLAQLPEETRVYPGHDYGQTPTSTVGWERTTNPYLLCAGEDAFVALRTGKHPPRPTRGPR